MIGVKDGEKQFIISTIIKFFPRAKIKAFGSRIEGTHRKNSDLDLLIETQEPNDFSKKGLLREELEQSNLPYRIDLVFGDQISEDFHKTILSNYQSWV